MLPGPFARCCCGSHRESGRVWRCVWRTRALPSRGETLARCPPAQWDRTRASLPCRECRSCHFSPHPNLGATASAQGRQARSTRLRRRRGHSLTCPLPPRGGKEHNLSPAHCVQESSEPGEELSHHVYKLLRLLIGWGMAAVLDGFQG